MHGREIPQLADQLAAFASPGEERQVLVRGNGVTLLAIQADGVYIQGKKVEDAVGSRDAVEQIRAWLAKALP